MFAPNAALLYATSTAGGSSSLKLSLNGGQPDVIETEPGSSPFAVRALLMPQEPGEGP